MFWKSKRVLITGGAGFVGSNLALTLHKLGASVEVIDSFSPYCGSNPFNLSEIEKRIRIHREDLNTYPLDAILAEKEFVFHLAGQIGHLFGQQKPEVDLEMNTRSALRVLEACKKAAPNAKLIYTGTRQVFGEPQYLPVDEKHPIAPLDINGIHKVAAENYFLHYHKVYGLKSCVLRLTNTYGPRQPIKNNQLGVVGWFINRVLMNETVTLANGGTQVRDFSFVDDTVEAMLKAAESESTWGEAFNLTGQKASLKDLAEEMIKLAGLGRIGDLQVTQEEKKIQLKDYYGTCEKLTKATGWTPKTSLRDGLRITLDYYSAHKGNYLT